MKKIADLKVTGLAATKKENHERLEVTEAKGTHVIVRSEGKTLIDGYIGAYGAAVQLCTIAAPTWRKTFTPCNPAGWRMNAHEARNHQYSRRVRIPTSYPCNDPLTCNAGFGRNNSGVVQLPIPEHIGKTLLFVTAAVLGILTLGCGTRHRYSQSVPNESSAGAEVVAAAPAAPSLPQWATSIWRSPETPELLASEGQARKICWKQNGIWSPAASGWTTCQVLSRPIFSTLATQGSVIAVFSLYEAGSIQTFQSAYQATLGSGHWETIGEGRSVWQWQLPDRSITLSQTDTGVSVLSTLMTAARTQQSASQVSEPVLDAATANELASYDHALTDRGMRRVGERATAFFAKDRQAFAFSLKTSSGQCYVVLLLGRGGITDADLLVLDAKGSELARDVETDRDALAYFCSSAGGTVDIQPKAWSGSGPLFLALYEGPPPPDDTNKVAQLPSWDGFKPDRPSARSSVRLSAAELYASVSESIYVVKTAQAQGSAVAISPRHLLTNCHVVESGEIVISHDGRVGKAYVMRADRRTDRCILFTDELRLTPISSVRSFRDLQIGEVVYAIGAPRGIEGTLSSGLISQLDASGPVSVIQTTAAISPGSSGGPLFDESGNLVGITTALLEGGQSLNFALAADEWWN